MRIPLVRLAAVAALALALALAGTPLVAAPATAAPHAATMRTDIRFGGHVTQTQLGYGGRFNIDGGNWGGYAATGSGFTSVTSTWTEPAVTCNSTDDLFAPWVGIDGFNSSTVEQTGVATDCSSGSPQYAAWYEMYPSAPVYYSNTVRAGDQIRATVTRSSRSYTLTLADLTQGWTRTTTRSSSRARNTSAEVIIESPTAAYPRFGTLSFSTSQVNGQQLAAVGPVALDPSNSGGFEAHTGTLSGGSFSITYQRE